TYPELAELAELAPDSTVMDGEIVSINTTSTPDFGGLQRRMKLTSATKVVAEQERTPVYYMVFDLLVEDGKSLMNQTYEYKRARVEQAFDEGHSVLIPPAHGSDRKSAFSASKELGLEGVIAKRTNSKYVPGQRSDAWLKIKHERHQ